MTNNVPVEGRTRDEVFGKSQQFQIETKMFGFFDLNVRENLIEGVDEILVTFIPLRIEGSAI